MRIPGAPTGNEPWGRIPTMVTREELRYLTEMAASTQGDVLEIGPWLGATTCALASGLSDRRRLHVVDTFRWRRFMEARAPLGLVDGASFRSAFEANLADYSGIIIVHEARLPDDFEGDVEFPEPVLERGHQLPVFHGVTAGLVFVDGAKSWTAIRHLLGTLRTGTAVVLQDYLYWASYFVPMAAAMAGLRVRDVLRHNSVSLEVAQDIDTASWPKLLSEMDVATGLQLIGEASSMVGGSPIVDLGAIPFLVLHTRIEQALETYLRIESSWPHTAPVENLVRCRRWLSSRTTVPCTARSRLLGLTAPVWRRATRLELV